jgi:hypothetical protein
VSLCVGLNLFHIKHPELEIFASDSRNTGCLECICHVFVCEVIIVKNTNNAYFILNVSISMEKTVATIIIMVLPVIF